MLRTLLALVSLGLTGAVAPAAEPPLRSSGVLRVLAIPTAPRVPGQHSAPGTEFFFTTPDGPPGFDREILEGFAQLHRLKMAVVTVPSWDGLIPALLEDKGDVIAGHFSVTEARARRIAFTAEVFPTRHVVFTRRPHPAVANVEQLRKEHVGTIKGSSMAELIAAAGVPPASVDDTIAPGGLPEALRSGKVTAAVLGVETVISAQQTDPALEIGAFLGPPGSLAFGVRKDDTDLLRALNDYIDNVRHSPTWSRLVVKYFGPAAVDVLKKSRER